MGVRLGVHRVPAPDPRPTKRLKDLPLPRSYDYKTGRISDDVVEQAEQTMRNVSVALVEAGAEVKDIVRVRYILPDRNDFPKTWPVLQKWLGDVRPAATMIQAGLMEEIMKIEIEVTARKPVAPGAGLSAEAPA